MKLEDFKIRISHETSKGFEIFPNISHPDFKGIKGDEYEFELFTGLKDIKGKEIYEGDILAVENSAKKKENRAIVIVYYDKQSLSFKFLLRKHLKAEINQFYRFETLRDAFGAKGKIKFEVLGNIHENAELLKEKENERVKQAK